MIESQYLLITLIGSLSAVAFFMIKNWALSWQAKLALHEERLGEHDVEIATISANMEHIRITADETREDVKELLRNQNASRSTSEG